MSLIRTLPDGPLDIIGDIHGESLALNQLLVHLGYDVAGRHPQGRTIVFVGDFIDRGPNSPAVLTTAQRLIESGRAVAVLGNHELNLLRESAKEGSGWYFDDRAASDNEKFAPYVRADAAHRGPLRDFLASLPVALERSDLRVVHAAWWPPAIEALRRAPELRVPEAWQHLEASARARRHDPGLNARLAREKDDWPHSLEHAHLPPPLLAAHAELDTLKQMGNPLRIVTSGVERPTEIPFWAGGKWRMVERQRWWDDYKDSTPVVIGHYWRRRHPVDRSATGKNDPDVFAGIAALHWLGPDRTVFCVDYSAGGRWRARKSGEHLTHHYKLAALRWPERVVVFDDGSVEPTV